jgi:hypothetical protein
VMQTASLASGLASTVMQGRARAASARMPLDKLYEYLRQHASGMLPPLNQRQMALETGWHQSSISRKMQQLLKHMARRPPAQQGEHITMPTPHEFEVPVPAVPDAQLAMLDVGSRCSDQFSVSAARDVDPGRHGALPVYGEDTICCKPNSRPGTSKRQWPPYP